MFSLELIFQADMPTVRVTAKASYEKYGACQNTWSRW